MKLIVMVLAGEEYSTEGVRKMERGRHYSDSIS
jgi:hypothetical protein